jgi:hypothetical protein
MDVREIVSHGADVGRFRIIARTDEWLWSAGLLKLPQGLIQVTLAGFNVESDPRCTAIDDVRNWSDFRELESAIRKIGDRQREQHARYHA